MVWTGEGEGHMKRLPLKTKAGKMPVEHLPNKPLLQKRGRSQRCGRNFLYLVLTSQCVPSSYRLLRGCSTTAGWWFVGSVLFPFCSARRPLGAQRWNSFDEKTGTIIRFSVQLSGWPSLCFVVERPRSAWANSSPSARTGTSASSIDMSGRCLQVNMTAHRPSALFRDGRERPQKAADAKTKS